jgi:hypothetical protein
MLTSLTGLISLTNFFSRFESLSKKLAEKWRFRSLVGLVSSRMQLFEECVSKLAKNLSNPSNSSFEADQLTSLAVTQNPQPGFAVTKTDHC